jgi:hypothetical protein
MSTTQQTTIGQRFTVIDCFDLTPEAIDCLTFAALDADLSLEAADAAYLANEIVLTTRNFRQSA